MVLVDVCLSIQKEHLDLIVFNQLLKGNNYTTYSQYIFTNYVLIRFEIDPEVALENISVARAQSSDHQTALLVQAAQMMSQER